MRDNDTATGRSVWPSLSFSDWKDTRDTLHMWTQIVGKTRLALSPYMPHWWHVTLYVTPRGLSTSSMPYGARILDAEFDFLDHRLVLRTDEGATRIIPLIPRSVADFYAEYRETLAALDISLKIYPVPVEIPAAIPFPRDGTHTSYDPDAAQRHWRILVHADRLFKQFRGQFIGKASPVHFFWGGFDLATTRFSGRRAPLHTGGIPNCPDYVMQDAYSHEVSSAGFWPGHDAFPTPAFYAYAYPAPSGFADAAVRPHEAYYHPELGEFILPYDAVRTAADPDRMVLEFLEDTYTAAARLGQWDSLIVERPR